jgi:hypothetical protein
MQHMTKALAPIMEKALLHPPITHRCARRPQLRRMRPSPLGHPPGRSALCTVSAPQSTQPASKHLAEPVRRIPCFLPLLGMRRGETARVGKPVWSLCPTHSSPLPRCPRRLVRDFLECAPGSAVEDAVQTLSATGEAVLRMVHTHEGAAAACMVLAYGAPKDRKKLVRLGLCWLNQGSLESSLLRGLARGERAQERVGCRHGSGRLLPSGVTWQWLCC